MIFQFNLNQHLRIANSFVGIHSRSPLLAFNLLILLAAFLTTKTVFANSDLPTIGDASSSLVSLEKERALGAAWLRSLRSNVKTFEDPITNEYLAQTVYSLAPNSNVTDKNFTLIIIDSPALNAFAVPGSVIGINAGLFIHAQTEQEFASVIAHELAHLGQRHYARRLERQKLSTPLAFAGLLASAIIGATAGSDAGIATLATTQALSVDQQLKFSRENEKEADRLAINTLFQSNYDPRAMPSMFERMLRNSRIQGKRPPEYLSTHPLSESRITDTRNRAEQLPRKRYVDNIDFHITKNLVISHYASSLEEATKYFNSLIEKGNTTQIQAAKFGLAYSLIESAPEKTINILNELLASHPNKIAFVVTKAKALSEQKKRKEASELLYRHLNYNPDNYPIVIALSQILLDDNRISEAELLMRRMSRVAPHIPTIWYQLAELNGLAGNIVDLHISRAEFFYLVGRYDDAITQLQQALKKGGGQDQKTALAHQKLDLVYEAKKQKLF